MVDVVTLADMKQHLSLTEDFGTADDALISRKIAAAVAHTEKAATIDFEDYGNAIPADLTEAVMLLAGHLYENREASLVGVTASTIPFGYDDLIRPYRMEWF